MNENIKEMKTEKTFYLVCEINDNDYTPSWTGNFTYTTAKIKGIFSNLQKAEQALQLWTNCEHPIIKKFNIWVQENTQKLIFDIYFDLNGEICLYTNDIGYILDKIYEPKEYDICYDPEHFLGNDDF